MAIHYVESIKDEIIPKLIDNLSKVARVGFDTETNGLDPYINQVLLIQLKVDDNIYVMNRGKLGKLFFTMLFELINKHDILCIGHNIKFDMKMVKQDTGVWLNNVFDTMIMEAVITSGLSGKYISLLELVNKYCGVELEKGTTLEFLDLNYDSSFTENQITYSALDVLYLFDIYDKQNELLLLAGMNKIEEIECGVEPVVAGMELQGIGFDIPYWNDITTEAKEHALELKAKMKDKLFESLPVKKYANALEFANAIAIPVKTKKQSSALESITDPLMSIGWAKDNFNLASHKQLLTILNLCGINASSTDEKVLNKLPKNNTIDIILEYRGYEKMISTYGDNVVLAVNPITGRIHADFNQVGTASGRFSSGGGNSKVNMQNMPTKTKHRGGFIAQEGFSFCSADYSQEEYRLAGAISREPRIIEAYVNGFDMHTATAALRFNKRMEDVTKDERYEGKRTNFTILYGGTEYALGKNLDMSESESREILKQFKANYPVLSLWSDAVESFIVKYGYSSTVLGRRRYWKELPVFSTPREVVNYENRMKREGRNHIIQGTAADVLKIAMINLSKNNPFGYEKFHLLIQIHDELVVEIHDSIVKDAEEYIKYEMNSALQPFLKEIPSKVDSHISKRWEKT